MPNALTKPVGLVLQEIEAGRSLARASMAFFRAARVATLPNATPAEISHAEDAEHSLLSLSTEYQRKFLDPMVKADPT